ncbi:MAG: hypothetical protein KDA92_07500, partial [Planctomycetales bacterium]|nr:hypothetical protein [Planctomycetales bacterium]
CGSLPRPPPEVELREVEAIDGRGNYARFSRIVEDKPTFARCGELNYRMITLDQFGRRAGRLTSDDVFKIAVTMQVL